MAITLSNTEKARNIHTGKCMASPVLGVNFHWGFNLAGKFLTPAERFLKYCRDRGFNSSGSDGNIRKNAVTNDTNRESHAIS